MMPQTSWTEADTQRASQFWEEYQKKHDVSALIGQADGNPNRLLAVFPNRQ